ncbi:hypothetical protein WJX72_009847 [[Myrmecia] bisecta]|uniref:Uncharacterized protein n=1 Tax=[Myrmecia] bisecta TaxID=41462 RepID=A0AAW1R936_9CHLO
MLTRSASSWSRHALPGAIVDADVASGGLHQSRVGDTGAEPTELRPLTPVGKAHRRQRAAHETSCPLTYHRQTVEDIRGGTKPYLFGGRQQPECNNCHKTDTHYWARVCTFEPSLEPQYANICSAELQQKLLERLLEQDRRELLELTPCDLWPMLQGRTTWIVGDSQSRHLYFALLCFLSEFHSLEVANVTASDEELFGPLEDNYVPASCLLMPHNTRVCQFHVNKGETWLRNGFGVLQRVANPQDVVVVNFGLWHTFWPEVYTALLRGFADYYQQHKHHLPGMVWKDTSPQHFPTAFGDFEGGEAPFDCRPVDQVAQQPDGSLLALSPEYELVARGGFQNTQAREILGRVGMPIIDTWNDTLPLWDYHSGTPGKDQECTHYCTGSSAPQLWVYAMYKQLKRMHL